MRHPPGMKKLTRMERSVLLSASRDGGTIYNPPAELRRRKGMIKFVSRIAVGAESSNRSVWRLDVYELLPRGWKAAAQLRGIESRHSWSIEPKPESELQKLVKLRIVNERVSVPRAQFCGCGFFHAAGERRGAF